MPKSPAAKAPPSEAELRREKLERMVYHEFLLEPDLHLDAGLEQLPRTLGKLLSCSPAEAIDRLTEQLELEELSIEQLRRAFAIRDMELTSRTAAAVAAELKEPQISYDRCIRTALCYVVADMESHAFSALRVAATKRDDWARHHFIYGLIHGIYGRDERAVWELDMALEHEPYEDGRTRIRHALALLPQPEAEEGEEATDEGG